MRHRHHALEVKAAAAGRLSAVGLSLIVRQYPGKPISRNWIAKLRKIHTPNKQEKQPNKKHPQKARGATSTGD